MKTSKPPIRNRILITGAAKRIGRSLAIRFAKEGYDVVIHYNKSMSDAEEVHSVCSSFGGNHHLVQADFSNLSQVRNLVRQLSERNILPSILVNNASIYSEDNFASYVDSDLDQHLMINFLVPVTLTKEFCKIKMVVNSVVNITDQRCFHPSEGHFSYFCSKASLQAVTEYLSMDLAPKVRLNSIAIGPTLPSAGRDKGHLEKISKNYLLQKTCSLEDVESAVVYLVKTTTVTGTTLIVDSGGLVSSVK